MVWKFDPNEYFFVIGDGTMCVNGVFVGKDIDTKPFGYTARRGRLKNISKNQYKEIEEKKVPKLVKTAKDKVL